MNDLSNIIRDFEKNIKVPFVKRIPKHEPTSRYYHIVGCIAECMLRCGEDNHHVHDVHGGYEEEMALLSNEKLFEKNFIGESIYGRRRI